jgi:hypothetical protein
MLSRDHSKHIKSQTQNHNIDITKYISKINILQIVLDSHFSEIFIEGSYISSFTNPLPISEQKTHILNTNISREVMELKCNATADDIIQFWKLLPHENLSSNVSTILNLPVNKPFHQGNKSRTNNSLNLWLKNLAIPKIIKLQHIGFAVLTVAVMNRYIFQDIKPEKFKTKKNITSIIEPFFFASPQPN